MTGGWNRARLAAAARVRLPALLAFALLVALVAALPAGAAAQVYTPLGPFSRYICVRYPDGSTDLGVMRTAGFEIVAFDEAQQEIRRQRRIVSGKIRAARERLRSASRRERPRLRKTIRRLVDQRTILTAELERLEDCRNEIPLEADLYTPQIFSYNDKKSAADRDRWYVFPAIVFNRPLKIVVGRRTLTFGLGSRWCLMWDDPEDDFHEPPLEYRRYATDDPCEEGLGPWASCKGIFGEKAFGLRLPGISNAESLTSALAYVGAQVARTDYFARPGTTVCNE